MFRKILLSTFTLGVTLFMGSNVFAENYKVNIAVLGDQQSGKTQIIRRIFGLSFVEESKCTKWTCGAYGREKHIQLDGDEFECNYYDAPGYLKDKDATLEEQINSQAVKDANIALIVVDPQQKKEDRACWYANSIHEALARHAANVKTVNPKCKIIIVANKTDTIPSGKLAEYYKMMESGKGLFIHFGVDGIFTSAKTGQGISELNEKTINFLREYKTEFPTFDSSFIICQKCGKKQLKNNGVQEGAKGDFYCGEACLKDAEAKLCSRKGCPSKERFLKVRNEGFESPSTHKMYCSIECCHLAEVGESCARKTYCPNKGKKYIRSEGQGFVSKHTGKLYCSKNCYIQEEGTYCDYDKCHNKFVVADGMGFYTNPKDGNRYCEEHKMQAAKTCTIL